jgi:hypothetical protein
MMEQILEIKREKKDGGVALQTTISGDFADLAIILEQLPLLEEKILLTIKEKIPLSKDTQETIDGLKTIRQLNDKFENATIDEKKQIMRDLRGMIKRITEGQ